MTVKHRTWVCFLTLLLLSHRYVCVFSECCFSLSLSFSLPLSLSLSHSRRGYGQQEVGVCMHVALLHVRLRWSLVPPPGLLCVTEQHKSEPQTQMSTENTQKQSDRFNNDKKGKETPACRLFSGVCWCVVFGVCLMVLVIVHWQTQQLLRPSLLRPEVHSLLPLCVCVCVCLHYCRLMLSICVALTGVVDGVRHWPRTGLLHPGLLQLRSRVCVSLHTTRTHTLRCHATAADVTTTPSPRAVLVVAWC